MSRREDPNRHRSRFDQQPSPKRSRRDNKLETERPPLGSTVDSVNHSGEEQRQRHNTGDSLPLDKSTKPDFKAKSGDYRKKSDERFNGRNEGAKRVSGPAEVRSQSYSQHDDRDNSGQGGRNFRRREATDRGWWKDSREQHGERSSRTAAPDTRRKENQVKSQGEDGGAWRHDKFSELQSEPNTRAKKRPAFREHKMDAEAERTAANPPRPNNSELPAPESEKKYDREGHNFRSWDRRERPTTGERGEANRRGKFLSTDRYGDDNGRDRFAARQGNRLGGGGRSDKWKHDLFDESNRSPPPKSEEDQIAKVEALLAS